MDSVSAMVVVVGSPPPGQPVAQLNDLFVDEARLIWVTDRIGGGLYVLEPEPWLAGLMRQYADPAVP